MKLSHAATTCLSLVALSLLSSSASAQVWGNPYEPQPTFGGASGHLDPFNRPRNEPSQTTGLNPAVRQALATLPPARATTPPTRGLTPGAHNALDYFGGASARQTLAQMPQQRRFVPQGGQPVGTGARVKPYNGAASDPTISPYLNLFREEDEDSAPNYYAFVRPYQQQVDTNRVQQRQLQSLQRKVQRTAYQAPAAGAMPPTGVRARFGDTGQFYSGWQR